MDGSLAVGEFVWIQRRQCGAADPAVGAREGRLRDKRQGDGRERIPVPVWTWR